MISSLCGGEGGVARVYEHGDTHNTHPVGVLNLQDAYGSAKKTQFFVCFVCLFVVFILIKNCSDLCSVKGTFSSVRNCCVVDSAHTAVRGTLSVVERLSYPPKEGIKYARG